MIEIAACTYKLFIRRGLLQNVYLAHRTYQKITENCKIKQFSVIFYHPIFRKICFATGPFFSVLR